jgi:uncharacterized protein (TIGR03000 family)
MSMRWFLSTAALSLAAIGLLFTPAAQARWWYGGWYGGYSYGPAYGWYGPGYYPWAGYGYYPSYRYGGYPGYAYYTPGRYYGTVVAPEYSTYTAPATTNYRSLYPPSTATTEMAPASSNEAIVRVEVPDPNASVWIEGAPTRQRGTERVFESPPLDPGRSYSYDIRARWTTAGGRTADETRHVLVRAGASATVDFNAPAPADSRGVSPAEYNAPAPAQKQLPPPKKQPPVPAPAEKQPPPPPDKNEPTP